jgi:hypothetical protein
METIKVSEFILGDVYSCLKVEFGMNVDLLDSNVMVKVLEKHFDLSIFENQGINFMCEVSKICKQIHRNPLKYFNFSYKKIN